MNYQKLYTTLFNAVTDSIREIEKQNYGRAKEILIKGQIQCEAIYLDEEE